MKRILDVMVFIQPYLVSVALLVAVVVMTSGCTTTSAEAAGGTRNFATIAVTTAAGGYVGAKEGDGKPMSAAAGAAAGFVVGETINYFNNKAQRDAYQAGYQKGQSNAVKQQYWIARENQRRVGAAGGGDDGYEEALYEIPVPQTDRDGVRREASTRVIRVVLPKEAGS